MPSVSLIGEVVNVNNEVNETRRIILKDIETAENIHKGQSQQIFYSPYSFQDKLREA